MPWDPWLPRCTKNLARSCQDSQDASKRVNPGSQNWHVLVVVEQLLFYLPAQILALKQDARLTPGSFSPSQKNHTKTRFEPTIYCLIGRCTKKLQLSEVDGDRRDLAEFEKKTRRERLKSAPYLRLKKRKTLFFGNKLKFLKKFFLSKEVA